MGVSAECPETGLPVIPDVSAMPDTSGPVQYLVFGYTWSLGIRSAYDWSASQSQS
jgi:hypothetical protein